MSIIKSIKQVLGLGPAAENHFWDGSVANQLSLKRGTPDAPGSTVMQVVDGAANFAVTPFGTFTPTLVGITSAGVGTYTTQFGDYRIVGKQVFINLALSWNAHTGSGAMRIDGLPFANYNRAIIVDPFVSGITMTAGNWMQAFVNASASTIGLRQVQQGGTSVDVPMDTSGTINVTGFYFLP